MIVKEKFTTTCEDGVVLRGILLIPESPKAVIQFNGGTAAKKEFYLPFLEYLSEHNYICCLWDYRGSGESSPASLRDCEYTFRDYGMKDMPAIKEFLTDRFNDLPILLFTHSAGGQQMGFMPNLEGYKGMVAFAVSTGYFHHLPIGYRMKALFLFYVFSPLSIFFTGYVNAKKLNIMENLPKNVVKEWRDWCSKENYFFDETFFGKTVPSKQFNNIPFPIHVFWATDDPISNNKTTPTLWSHIKSKEGITFKELVPSEFKLKNIGHFGFFKKSMKPIFWDMGLNKLDEYLTKSPKTTSLD